MRFIVGVIAGASIAAGAMIMTDPAYMRRMKRKYKCAKKTIMNMV